MRRIAKILSAASILCVVLACKARKDQASSGLSHEGDGVEAALDALESAVKLYAVDVRFSTGVDDETSGPRGGYQNFALTEEIPADTANAIEESRRLQRDLQKLTSVAPEDRDLSRVQEIMERLDALSAVLPQSTPSQNARANGLVQATRATLNKNLSNLSDSAEARSQASGDSAANQQDNAKEFLTNSYPNGAIIKETGRGSKNFHVDWPTGWALVEFERKNPEDGSMSVDISSLDRPWVMVDGLFYNGYKLDKIVGLRYSSGAGFDIEVADFSNQRLPWRLSFKNLPIDKGVKQIVMPIAQAGVSKARFFASGETVHIKGRGQAGRNPSPYYLSGSFIKVHTPNKPPKSVFSVANRPQFDVDETITIKESGYYALRIVSDDDALGQDAGTITVTWN